MGEYRNLNDNEITQLEHQRCSSDDWSKILVSDGFDPSRVVSVNFSGDVKIGSQQNTITLPGGVQKKTGIYNASIHNCTIGNNVYINKVDNYIANYEIGDSVIVNHIRMLYVDGPTTFGNGIEAVVINEAGGREIPIFDHLSSQMAYILALYRHDKKLTENILKMISKYVDSVKSETGIVAENAIIMNCGTIKNVKIGPSAILDGLSSLENGTINSCSEDPAFVGTNVIAKDFIMSEGSKVSDNSIVAHCFIGQATELAKQYSAENSIFFANCGGYHGEACSIFAGPYTVTHHKSTLLIAGMYSFFNAGSGSNQSNHMYKLGPVHQGIVERGSKTTSDSYILWPARVGAFSLVMGRHYNNSDTSKLPFSYLIEHQDESHCMPGVNIRSVGTVRDSRKWPKRDKRKSPRKLDYINFNLLTPYTVQKMIDGRQLLQEIQEKADPDSNVYYYNGVKIKRSSLQKGIAFYTMGIDRYLGNIIVQKIRQNGYSTIEELRTMLKLNSDIGKGEWLDLSGLLIPRESLDAVMSDIISGEISTFAQLDERFNEIHSNFLDYELVWVKDVLEKQFGKQFEEFTAKDFSALVSNWIKSVEKLDLLRMEDARKEFAPKSQIGFGVDGGPDQRIHDFENTRGSEEENDFIQQLKAKLQGKKNTAAELIEKFSKM